MLPVRTKMWRERRKSVALKLRTASSFEANTVLTLGEVKMATRFTSNWVNSANLLALVATGPSKSVTACTYALKYRAKTVMEPGRYVFALG